MTSTTHRTIDIDSLHLGEGGHPAPPADGTPPAELCINELVTYMAGEPHSDQPKCVSPVLRAFALRLNDALPDEPRQRLKAFAPLMVGTAGDGHDDARRELASQWLMRDVLPKRLRLAKLDELAAQAETAAGLTGDELTEALRAIRKLTWDVTYDRRATFRRQVEAKLLEKFKGAAWAAWAAEAAEAAEAAWAAWAAEAAEAAWAAWAAEAAWAAWAAWAAEAAVDKLTWEQRDRMYQTVRTAVYDKVRAWFEESEQAQAIRDQRATTIDGAIDLLERMCTVGRE
jgi:hypothetical protein